MVMPALEDMVSVPRDAIARWRTAMALMAFVSYASSGVGSALVTDLVPPDALGHGMAAFNATTWVGAVVGFLGAGYAFRAIGPAESFLAGAGLMVLAVALLAPIAIEARNSRPASKTAELLSDREGPP